MLLLVGFGKDIVVLMCKVKYSSIRYIALFLWSKLNKRLSYEKLLASLAGFRNKIRKLNFSGYISDNRNCYKLK